MALLTHEPALGFWLRYVEREGALVEEHGDHALVLLPEPLAQAGKLAEETTVTANPDVAREDGAVLLIAGHPELERAAGAVLGEGDAGEGYLAWPASRPPTRSTLEARARELLAVDRGRIDAAGEPIAAYLPLLRVGAMVSYAASLALRFHEQEEAWVDARSGLPLSARVLAAVRGRPLLPRPDRPVRILPADLSPAIAAAHGQLEQTACRRKASLATQAKRMLESELARADAYYESALESIARRRARAGADRARLLEAQAEATRAERDRRRREITQEHDPRHQLRPFRLHLVYVPAYVLPVNVRRGTRAFGLEVAWLPAVGAFTATRCPACGAAEPLVASREQLGCRACTRQAAPAAGATAAPPEPAPERSGASGSPAPRAPSRSAARLPPARVGAATTARRPSEPQLQRTGSKLAVAFWQSAADGRRWPRHKTVADSPLRAVYRLYGDAGPLCAIGAPPGAVVQRVAASTCAARPGTPHMTVGDIATSDAEVYPFALVWRLSAGKPVIGELMPAPHPLVLPPLDGDRVGIGQRLRGAAPTPIVALDPVAALLWATELEEYGLPFAIRCLAAWWRVPAPAEPLAPHEALAAAVTRAVARAGAIRRTLGDAADLYRTEAQLVARVEPTLTAELRLDRGRGW